jgi:hypothetical protein
VRRGGAAWVPFQSMRSRLSPSVIGGRHMKLLRELAHDHFLPEPDSPELGPFTRAFMHMMFAHVEFERRVAELANVVTLTAGFGETEALGSAKERPKRFTELCAKNHNKHPGGLPEADAIAKLLDEAFRLCNERNWLAHGIWWRIDTVAGIIDVHAVRPRKEGPLSREFTVNHIQQIAESFKDVEAELWKLQRAIQARLSDPLAAARAPGRSAGYPGPDHKIRPRTLCFRRALEYEKAPKLSRAVYRRNVRRESTTTRGAVSGTMKSPSQYRAGWRGLSQGPFASVGPWRSRRLQSQFRRGTFGSQ